MKYKQIFHQLLELSRVIGNQWQTVPPLIWHIPNQEELSTYVEMQDRWRKPRSHTTILEGFGDATLLPSNWIRVFLEEKWGISLFWTRRGRRAIWTCQSTSTEREESLLSMGMIWVQAANT